MVGSSFHNIGILYGCESLFGGAKRLLTASGMIQKSGKINSSLASSQLLL